MRRLERTLIALTPRRHHLTLGRTLARVQAWSRLWLSPQFLRGYLAGRLGR